METYAHVNYCCYQAMKPERALVTPINSLRYRLVKKILSERIHTARGFQRTRGNLAAMIGSVFKKRILVVSVGIAK